MRLALSVPERHGLNSSQRRFQLLFLLLAVGRLRPVIPIAMR
jgi:hypothetical protein